MLAHSGNRLIDRLPAVARKALMRQLQPMDMHFGEILHPAGDVVTQAVFPREGYLSLLAGLPDAPSVEVGLAGREGMFGAELALGARSSPLHVIVQHAGPALAIGAADFRAELERSPALRRTMQQYLEVRLIQLTAVAPCLRHHHIEARLARWMLMCADRAGSPDFSMTHEFLALMLGVRRAGVSTSAASLQRLGLIAYRRGQVHVLDRAGLEAAACTCYAQERRTYAQVIDGT